MSRLTERHCRQLIQFQFYQILHAFKFSHAIAIYRKCNELFGPLIHMQPMKKKLQLRQICHAHIYTRWNVYINFELATSILAKSNLPMFK